MAELAIRALQEMKRAGRKIVGIVAWDAPMAELAERAGADLVSVGDSVGANLWGRSVEEPVSIEEMLIVCKAVRRGVKRALLSCDVPSGALEDARRLIEEGGADIVKVLASPEKIERLVRANLPVFAEFHGGRPVRQLVEEARAFETAGAALLDFRHSGAEAGAAVAKAVSIPVLGGMGGGPWLDGRLRLAHEAIGYAPSWLDSPKETYANVARVTLDALSAYAEDVRQGRQIKGQRNG